MKQLIILLVAFCGMQSVYAIDTLRICPGESVQLAATPGLIGYEWSPAIDLSNPFSPIPTATPSESRLYVSTAIQVGNNLIENGDFEQGNTGFTTDHNFTTTPTNDQQSYGIFSNPRQHNAAFAGCMDHTPGSGTLMMTVDAAQIPDQTAWCSEVTVTPNTNYIFSAWMTALVPQSPSTLSFNINGEPIGQTLQVSNITCFWQEFYAEWNSGSAVTATICLNNENTEPFGNDFALDDISFAERIDVPSDSFFILVNPSYAELEDTSICSNQRFDFLGQSFPPNTDTIFQLQTNAGCDSTIRLVVGLEDTILLAFRVDTLCPGDTFFLRGQAYTQDTLVCNTFSSLDACDSTICTNIVFLTEQAIVFDLQEPSCNGLEDGSITVDVQAGLPPFTLAWENGSSSSIRTDLEEGSYSLTVTDSKGCSANTTAVLNSPDSVTATVLSPGLRCADDQNGQIDVTPNGGTPPYEWSIDGINFISTDQPFDNLNVGDYQITIRDINGCQINRFSSITSPPPLLIDVPDSLETVQGSTIILQSWTNANQPATYQWISPDELSCNDCPAPSLIARNSGYFTVQVTDSVGCLASDSLWLSVIKNYQVFIPNVFSPNADGTNDIFQLFPSEEVLNIQSFQIFDRWGALVHEEENCSLSGNICGWDGRHKGEKAAIGVYVYLMEVEFWDGEIRRFSGDVTLVR